MIENAVTSFPCKRGLPEEEMAIGNIGTGNIPALATIEHRPRYPSSRLQLHWRTASLRVLRRANGRAAEGD